ncbi:unnamed protein product [Chironomus riparius]|uniref:FZ domain-containing protein n=1 Tax=Chironomus riparius TaxID=315576 RepID=A0A9N9S4V7_9DIPT|nr:unnamed protein product [Chironomus riparius]
MVSKSYVVSKSKTVGNQEEASDVCDSKMQAIEHVKSNSKNKNFGFIINVNEVRREMVKMKPSKKYLHDDNSSSATTSTSYWNNINIIKWNRESLEKTVHYIDRRFLYRIIAACLMIALIALIVTSSSSTSSSSSIHKNKSNLNNSNDTENAEQRQRLLVSINKAINNISSSSSIEDSIIDTTTKISIIDVTTSQQSNSVLPILTTYNIIASQNGDYSKKSNDEVTLTNNYVERINFYTTSNKNLFSAKVSPTLPSINKNYKSTSEIPVLNYANDCESTSLPLCQGISTYDLTDSKQKWNLTNLEYQHFEHLINSNCSNRVHEYVCHMLEPECRPSQVENLKPCRRICKGIFESCSHIIASSEVLTEFFDCNTYIDSNDMNVCEDITRSRKNCYNDEFKCGDLSCIPLKWRCDNIRDCANGDDEDECKFCNYDEFKCLSDQSCISEKWLCDGFDDCLDGSDETNCDTQESDEEQDTRIFYDDIRDYTDQASIDHNDSDGDKIISTGDDVMPIFINPNTTDTNESQMSSSAQMSKRFRSTMRKQETTTPKDFEETSTKITKRVTFHSTSHSSPCPEDHLRCIDGLCITLDQICDKIRDCSDNSDELHCEY